MQTIQELCDIIRQTAYDIHHFHGHGHLEKVYENASVHRSANSDLRSSSSSHPRFLMKTAP
jgi:hypothetical protein